MMKILNCWKM